MNFIYFLRMKRAGSIIPYERLYRTGTLPGTGTVLVLYLVCTGRGSAMILKKISLLTSLLACFPKPNGSALSANECHHDSLLGILRSVWDVVATKCM
jgi:hypothetical protein